MPAMKPTRFMTNPVYMKHQLSRTCDGLHKHQQLVGGRAKEAENYSIELITEILRGMRDTADFEDECHELYGAADCLRRRHLQLRPQAFSCQHTEVEQQMQRILKYVDRGFQFER